MRNISYSIEDKNESNPDGSGIPVGKSDKGNPVSSATDNGKYCVNHSSSDNIEYA